MNELNFFYNSRGADIEDMLVGHWFHTSSLRNLGANLKFSSNTGCLGSSSDDNSGNVTCIELEPGFDQIKGLDKDTESCD